MAGLVAGSCLVNFLIYRGPYVQEMVLPGMGPPSPTNYKKKSTTEIPIRQPDLNNL